MAIPKPHRDNFETLKRAFDDGNVCLMECTDKSGDPVYVICAVNSLGEEVQLAPFAQLFNDNPYELLNPPTPEET